MSEPVLSVRNLRVEFATRHNVLRAIDGISFDIAKGEVLGVVGESGAGKSVTGLAVIGLIDRPGRIAGGEIHLSGLRIDNLPPEEMRRIRGKRIGMIFQDPLTSLNPLYRIGDQLIETIRTHTNLSEHAARKRAIDLLAEVGIPAPEKRIDAYPHEFSGGMRQRVVIALAICAEPELIIADEPTTALDVSVQAQIITLIKRLGRDHGTAVMLVTHDMGVIAETSDRVAVMYSGRIAEIGPVRDVVQNPLHPYAKGLMGAIPTLASDAARLVQIPGTHAAACPRSRRAARSIRAAPSRSTAAAPSGRSRSRMARRRSPAISTMPHQRRPRHDGKAVCRGERPASRLRRFEAVAQSRSRRRPSGISQSRRRHLLSTSPRARPLRWSANPVPGKTTVARMVVGLLPPTFGEVVIDGVSMTDPRQAQARRQLRRRIQMIFQDPYASLNPRLRVDAIIAEPIRAFDLMKSEADIRGRVGELLGLVGLHADDGWKYPHEFSGGQRQRIAIARALASEAEFIVCDEPTSALDVSVQAQILNLMRDLQDKFGLTYLLISHNLAVVRHMANAHRRDVSRPRRRDRGSPRIVRCAAHALHEDAARRGA